MLGIPYWGKETFSDVRKIVQLDSKKLSIESLNELVETRCKYVTKVDSLESLFVALAELDFLFVLEQGKFVSWCKDIRFNYRDKEIFVPYYAYATIPVVYQPQKENPFLDIEVEGSINLRYHHDLRKHLIDTRTSTSRMRDSTVTVYDRHTHSVYLLDIENLPYASETPVTLTDLHNLYQQACYSELPLMRDLERETYIGINDKFYDRVGKYLRKREGLDLYAGEFNQISYTDVRIFSYKEIFGDNLIDFDAKPHWLRTLLFESKLFAVFADDKVVCEEHYRRLWDKLGVNARFIKVGASEPYLILKHYYKNSSHLKPKTFERGVFR